MLFVIDFYRYISVVIIQGFNGSRRMKRKKRGFDTRIERAKDTRIKDQKIPCAKATRHSAGLRDPALLQGSW